MPPKQARHPFVMDFPIEGLQQLFGLFGGPGGIQLQQIREIEHRGVGHIFQGEMHPRTWIDREQRRGQSPQPTRATGFGLGNNNGYSSRAAPVEVPLTANQHRDRGNQAFRVGNLQEALTEYTAALNNNPGCETALTNRATTHFKLKNYEAAATDARRAIQIKPDYFKAHYRLGMSLSQLGYFEEAREALKRAESLAPTDDDKQDIRIQIAKAESKLKTRNAAREDAAEKMVQQRQMAASASATATGATMTTNAVSGSSSSSSVVASPMYKTPDSPNYVSSFAPITPLGPPHGFPADVPLPAAAAAAVAVPVPPALLLQKPSSSSSSVVTANTNPEATVVVSLDTVADLAKAARTWRGFEQEGETFVNDNLVEALALLTSTTTTEHEKHILQECNPAALQRCLDDFDKAQDELRKAARDSADREKFHAALQNRDDKLQTALKVAAKSRFALQKLQELRSRNDACRSVIQTQLQHVIPTPTSSARRSHVDHNNSNSNSKGKRFEGERDEDDDDDDEAAEQEAADIPQLIQEFKHMKKDLAGEIQSAMARTDRAAAEFLTALKDEQKIIQNSSAPSNARKLTNEKAATATAAADDDPTTSDAKSYFKPLRDVSARIISAARHKLDVQTPLLPPERVRELDALIRRAEDDRSSLQRATFDGQRLLDLESIYERDRLNFERQRIQLQAELDWLLVKEEEDQKKIDSLRRSIDRVKEQSTSVGKKQREVQAKLVQLIDTDLPELAWKAAAGGKKILKWAKGSGYWVNLSLSDFEIIRTVASTPSSKVLQARSKRDGTVVAIKEIQVETEALRRRFQNEINIVTGLAAHKNVLQIQGVFFDGPFAYIVMPFYALGSLLDFMKKTSAGASANVNSDGSSSSSNKGGAQQQDHDDVFTPMKEWRLQELLRQIVSGVASLHEQGVVHADIKPGNILLNHDMSPVLSDFGLARDVGRYCERADITVEATNFRGTENFAAPELLNPQGVASSSASSSSPTAAATAAGKPTMRSDIYSLGISLLQLAANNHKALEINKEEDQRRRQREAEEREEREVQRARERQQQEMQRLRDQLQGIPGVTINGVPLSATASSTAASGRSAASSNIGANNDDQESPTTTDGPLRQIHHQEPSRDNADDAADAADASTTTTTTPSGTNPTTTTTTTGTANALNDDTASRSSSTSMSSSSATTTRAGDHSRALIVHPTHQHETFQILFPQAAAGKTVDPKVVGNDRLADLLTEMISTDPGARPSAQEILAHPYFSVSLLEESVKSHQLEESNQKLEALSSHIHALRALRRNPILVSVERSQMVESVSSIICQMKDDALLNPLFVVFRGEEGLDEGGLTGEMIQTYFMQAVTHHRMLVCSSSASEGASTSRGGYIPAQSATPENEISSSSSTSSPPMKRESTTPTSADGDDVVGAQKRKTPSENASTTSDALGVTMTRLPGDPEVLVDVPYLPSEDRLIPPGLFDNMGRILLKALIENRPIPILLSNVVFKHIVGLKPNMLDLEEYDRPLWRSLRQFQFLSAEEIDAADLNFDEFPAEMLTHDLKMGSAICNKAVSQDNVKRYIAAKAYHTLVYSRKAALDAIKAGFFACELLKPHLQLMSPVELQIALCGQQHITARDLIALLDFVNFPSDSNTPKYFVEAIANMSQNNMRRFLRLATSSVTIPRGGQGRSARIRILCTQDTERLPVGHTCVNQLDLPNYDDKEKLNKHLAIALAHAEDGFFVM